MTSSEIVVVAEATPAQDVKQPPSSDETDPEVKKESAPEGVGSEERSPRRSRSFSAKRGEKGEKGKKSGLTRTLSLRLLGNKKDSTSGERSGVVRKTSFKKIRGIFNREARRSRRASKKASSSSSTLVTTTTSTKNAEPEELPSLEDADDDDVSTFNVNVDDRSVANSTVASSTKLPNVCDAYLLRVVLLLMDVNSKRFELLQLEFDSEKALVSDLLSQIPISVTEEALKGQEYEAIVTVDAQEVHPESKLADFCKGNDVVVAVPKGLSPHDAHKLAKPILSNVKVVGMVSCWPCLLLLL